MSDNQLVCYLRATVAATVATPGYTLSQKRTFNYVEQLPQ